YTASRNRRTHADKRDARRRRLPKIAVERPGARPERPIAPPGRCDGCGCDLSRYRAPSELNCWACLSEEPGQLLPAERQRRVALFLEGRSSPHSVHLDYICRVCGGLKSAGASRCARCRYAAPHPRKPIEQALKSGPCPVCGGKK